MEALLRLLHGTKLATETSDLPMQRLSIVLSDDSDWHGCHIELKAEDGECVVDLVPQVRFARRGRPGWIFVTEEALSKADYAASQCGPTSPLMYLIHLCFFSHGSEIVADPANTGLLSAARGVEGAIAEPDLAVQFLGEAQVPGPPRP